MNRPKELPNSDGFKFVGVTYNHVEKVCTVICDPDTGVHFTAGIKYCDLIGWKNISGKDEKSVNGS